MRLRWLPEQQQWTSHVAGAAVILQPCGSKQHGWSSHAACAADRFDLGTAIWPAFANARVDREHRQQQEQERDLHLAA